jgi:hypothetical protein
MYSNSLASLRKLKALALAMKHIGISTKTRRLFERMASYPPPLRLAINIKTFMGETAVREVEDILRHGITPAERAALVELDSSKLPVHLREVAHGLLNLHERWIVKRALSKPIRDGWSLKDYYYDPKVLDDILSMEEDYE